MSKLGPYDLNQIYTGDARELSKSIPNESVDLILCDPVYWQIEDYTWLARLAEKILKTGGSVVAQCGTVHRFWAEQAMRLTNLTPQPLIIETFSGGFYQLWKHRTLSCWHPFIWMTKGERENNEWVHDWIKGAGRDKSSHAWGDTDAAFIHLIERLTKPDDIVIDPFCGGGTTLKACKKMGRNFLAFEIDSDTAEIARMAVMETKQTLMLIPYNFEHIQLDFSTD